MAKAKLHIDSPFIEGNKQGLLALKDAVDAALCGDVAQDRFARTKAEDDDGWEQTYCVRLK